MVLRSMVIGATCTVALIVLLALSRDFEPVAEEPLEVLQVETIELAPPPAPPELTPTEDQPEDTPPPPAPALDLPSELPSIDAPAISLSLTNVPLTMPVQLFSSDSAPAEIATKPAPIARPQPAAQPKSKPRIKPRRAQKTAAREKSHYSVGELDVKPRQRYTGKYKWPRGAKGSSASVKLSIEISTSGHVKVISVVSSTNPALNPAAIQVASGSRFTPPLLKGRPVKARFYKTYLLKK